MPERTSYEPGTPSWMDLSTTDPEGAAAFYTAVFGWGRRDVPVDDQGNVYTMFLVGDKRVAAQSAMDPEQQAHGIPSHWNTYVNVASADDAAARAEASGGTVLVAPFDVLDEGRMAVIQDPAGGILAVWEPGKTAGADLVQEAGALAWNELMTDDTGAAASFYGDVFGWQPETRVMSQGQEYTSFKLGDAYVAGMMAKTADMGDVPSAWMAYYAVDDVDAAADRAREAGGGIVAEPFDVPEVGRIAIIADPLGAVLGIMKYAAPQEG